MSKGKGEALERWYEGQNSIWKLTQYLPVTLGGLKQTLCTPGPREPTDTESELCLTTSSGGAGQQWTAAGAGALGAADVGVA